MFLKTLKATGLALATTTALSGAAFAAQFEVTVVNNSSAGGLFLTPFLSIFHDGSFDTFDLGGSASAGVEAIAEDGNVAVEQARADAAGHATRVITGPAGFPGAPLIDPGETTSQVVDLDLTVGEALYFSFLSMLLPTNDNFIGNGNPLAYQLFDAAGNFTATEIQVFGSEVWDAGTEDNTGFGLPFSTAGGTATDTIDGSITQQGDLSFLLGRGTPVGDISSVQGSGDLLATISFTEIAAVPLPAALPMLLGGLGLLGFAGTRRRKTA